MRCNLRRTLNSVTASTSAGIVDKILLNNDLLNDEKLALRGDFNGVKSSIINNKVKLLRISNFLIFILEF